MFDVFKPLSTTPPIDWLQVMMPMIMMVKMMMRIMRVRKEGSEREVESDFDDVSR
jgi:hypothetical protein